MALHHQDGEHDSPFIRDIEFVPPSPDFRPPSSYEPALEYPSNPLGSPPFIDNSGSYQNSPYSGHSELSFVTAENELPFDIFHDEGQTTGLFDSLSTAGISVGNDFDYDPAEYDGPQSASSLLMYSDNDLHYISSPPAYQGAQSGPSNAHQSHRAGSVPYDYSSPSSTDDPTDRRSRASSVSSAHQAQQQTQYSRSPRLEVAQSFENMSVRSPNWGTEQLPPTGHKAPSPPRLLMPEGYPVEHQDPPTINAPDGDGTMGGGPQLHIVPATPISMGAAGAAAAPFQTPSEPLTRDANLRQSQQSWNMNVPSHDQSTISETPTSRQPSPFRFPAPPDDHSSANRQSFQNQGNNVQNTFLFPQQSRVRSKSDNGLEPPAWDPTFIQQQSQQLHQQTDNSALGLDLELSGGGVEEPALGTASSTASASYPIQSFNFGGQHSVDNNNNGNFLSPDAHSQVFGMRRVKSDSTGGRPLGHRQSRSEDIRGLQQPGLQQQQQPQQQSPFLGGHSSNSNFHHGHSLSLSASQGQMLFPPSDFMSSGGQPQNPNLLSTSTLPIPPSVRSLSPGGRGHFRRASSGSRSERGVGAESWLGTYSQGGSNRASPYPSPNASPRVRYDHLELDLERENELEIPTGHPSAGFENEVALSGRMGLGTTGQQPTQQGMLDVNGFLGAANNLTGMGVGVPDVKSVQQLSKPNVTTLRTANASHKRRKQEATFKCPFPGCGSTFTRSFNLKGHIRSHNEEKPFVCKWPGCGKGFARQHDCKRHEQLHTNYRPFTCDGCSRQFARMDALNRHLRSEGGAECARSQGGGGSSSDASTPAPAQSPPPELSQSPPTRTRRQAAMSYGSANDPWNVPAGTSVGVSL